MIMIIVIIIIIIIIIIIDIAPFLPIMFKKRFRKNNQWTDVNGPYSHHIVEFSQHNILKQQYYM